MDAKIALDAGDWHAALRTQGAELLVLRRGDRDLLWRQDPKWWEWTSPILFPVVARSIDATIRIDGQPYPMPPHGFARDREFRILERDAARVKLELFDDAQTRAHYPFAFALRFDISLDARGILIAAEIENRDARPMPFGFGYHPAFVWTQDTVPRAGHVCLFERNEPATIRRGIMETGLLRKARFDSPVVGKRLDLDDSLFVPGALQFDRLASRRLWFGRPGEEGLDIGFPDSPHLGIWTKPGAPYLCVEPWQGFAEEEGADGELARRPGTRLLEPGGRAVYRLSVGLAFR
ncbi:MAG: aldose 1-epimerase family protein [Tagaea sp.]|nr:aldose 1-epimerase family protein [Tagaea sp.]